MRRPQVTVRVQEYATQDVSVLGQVHTPGTYAITTPQTILKVLSLAGGLTESADRNVVIKRKKTGEENDQSQIFLHDGVKLVALCYVKVKRITLIDYLLTYG